MITENSPIAVLDHGFVALRNLAGPTRRVTYTKNPDTDQEETFYRAFDADDTDPANAARLSFGKLDMEGRDYEAEMKLTHYLMRNKHMTPFEMIVVWLEMKLPIFVARQFVRHGTARLNEVSGRYKELPAEWYIPHLADVVLQAKDKKQGGVLADLSDVIQRQQAFMFRERLNGDCQRSYDSYRESIAAGIAMEQARLHLHVNHYTHWLWKQDLRNLFGFLVLRDHGHAQREAQHYARAITQLLDPHIPGLMNLYREIMRGEGKTP